MSYLVLARKYRPQQFADVVGQEHVLKALAHALDHQRLHHAYLFSGTRGVGKTTLARILAKALNCEQGVSATPCGVCSACTEIDSGRFVDLIEVDAASRTKVDDTRELLDNVQYAATRGRFKVYLIDEVHMLSTHSFNALLKTLEEPPDHVKFLLATTDPQKLPVTVLSRCLQFNLKRMTPELIADRLAHIASAEGIEAAPQALRLLARAADGSLRDALSLMDQAIAFADGALPEQDVAQMLGTLDAGFVTRILAALETNDAAAMAAIVSDADAHMPDYGQLLDDLARALTRIALAQAGVPDEREESAVDVQHLADALPPEAVQLYYQIAISGRRDLPMAPDARTGTEMTLLRMLAFRPDDGVTSSAAARRDTDSATRPSGRGAASAAAGRDVAASGHVAAAVHEPAPAPATGGAVPEGDSEWYRTVGALELDGVARMLAANCAWEGETDGCIRLSLDRRSASLLTDARVATLASALTQHLGREVTVSVDVDGASGVETPSQRAGREAQDRQAAAVRGMQEDAGVAALRELMDGQLDEASVQVREPAAGSADG